MMRRLLIRCSVRFLTSSVMPCGMLPAWSLIFKACGIEHDIRSSKLRIVPSYRYVQFVSLDVIQSSSRLVLHVSVNEY